MTNSDATNADTPVLQIDPVLQLVVSAMSSPAIKLSGDKGLPIILTVHGLLISGLLISYQEYQRLSSISPLFDILREKEKALDDASTKQPPPQHIHLKSAKFYDMAGRSIPSNEDALWRGRLCMVSGFMFGQLAPVAAPSISQV